MVAILANTLGLSLLALGPQTTPCQANQIATAVTSEKCCHLEPQVKDLAFDSLLAMTSLTSAFQTNQTIIAATSELPDAPTPNLPETGWSTSAPSPSSASTADATGSVSQAPRDI